jgi:hypothetical protein
MARDQEIVKQLQQRFADWKPDSPCAFHFDKQCCVYDESGRIIELHLCGLELTQTPWEVWQCSSLQRLCLTRNELSTLPAEIGNLSSLNHAQVGSPLTMRPLELFGNPLQSPLAEMSAKGTSAILAYLRALQPIKIFYCYAHEDRDLRDRIDKHLGVLKRRGHIVVWYDREIQAGMEWEREIERRLSTAHIILLLVSADFVHSDYCYGKEMQRALELHEKGRVHVLPILLRPVDWQDAPFSKLQILPTGAKPITKWPDPEEALEDVARQIRSVVTALQTYQS